MKAWTALVCVLAAAFIVGYAYLAFHVDEQAYKSPCLVSWDENDGDSTLCVLTEEAARQEHEHDLINTPKGARS